MLSWCLLENVPLLTTVFYNIQQRCAIWPTKVSHCIVNILKYLAENTISRKVQKQMSQFTIVGCTYGLNMAGSLLTCHAPTALKVRRVILSCITVSYRGRTATIGLCCFSFQLCFNTAADIYKANSILRLVPYVSKNTSCVYNLLFCHCRPFHFFSSNVVKTDSSLTVLMDTNIKNGTGFSVYFLWRKPQTEMFSKQIPHIALPPINFIATPLKDHF